MLSIISTINWQIRYVSIFLRKVFIFFCLVEHIFRNGIVSGVKKPKFSSQILKVAHKNQTRNSQFNNQRAKQNEYTDLEIWRPFFDKMGSLIPTFNSTKEAIDFCQTKIMFDHRSIIEPTVVRMFIHYERILKKEFSGNLKDFYCLFESNYSWKKSLFRFEGKIVSGIFYWHTYIYLSIISKFQSHYTPSTICEIGGGYGALARLFLLNKNNFEFERFILIDHGNSLFFAEIFLRQNFNNVKFSYVNEKIDQNSDVIFCPFTEIHLLKDLKIDIVLNTGSFQEMPTDWVSFYINWVDSVEASYLYSCNYFGQGINELAESQNFFCPEMPANWSLIYSRQNPTILWMQTQNRDFGEFFFERRRAGTRKNNDVKTIKCQQDFMDGFFKIKDADDTKLIWDFIQITIRDLHYIPKEILFLLERISNCPNLGSDAKKLQSELLPQISKTKYSELEEIFGAD